MPVGIACEDLPRAVRTFFARTEISLRRLQVRFPRVEVIDAERKMIAAIVRVNRFGAFADEMQFLLRAQSKPCAGKIKRRTRHRFEPQHGLKKVARRREVAHMERDVIEFQDLHKKVL